MNGEGEDASKVIHVKLITKLDSPFKVPVTSVVIPSSVTRLGLSLSLSLPVSLVSWLCAYFPLFKVPEKPEPFDSLIDGELIRMSPEQFLNAKGISAVDTTESGDTTTRLGAFKILRGHRASVAGVTVQKYGSRV
ncbi:hypothetical protein F2Q70_00006038 [Brassica cretica]|uniref:NLE domain-containing protein n=1 Tax=Brassica cretica TaxID=69181 RepID=A0A8S9ISM4_BRACR|nr:hypothetical protein F2Q70_00006038 [Brassica cretica]